MISKVTRRELLSPAEVAERLGVTRQTIYRKIHSGQMPALRLGDDGPLRVDAAELDEWLAANAVPRGEDDDG
jgi:excisionase family DNA binding protein